MLCLIRAKACKRCGGDVSLECDAYGVYAECIQCGATWYRKSPRLRLGDNAGNSRPTQAAHPPAVATSRGS
jgi:hypothetical protein